MPTLVPITLLLLGATSCTAAQAPAADLAAEAPAPFLPEAASAITVLQRHWYMHGANGSWVSHGPGNGTGRYDTCLPDIANQSCKCNGAQGNWVRANTIEAIANYQALSGVTSYDEVIAASWPNEGFEINSAAPFSCDPLNPAPGQAMNHGDPGWPYYDDILWYTLRGETDLAAEATQRGEKIFEHVASRAWNDTEAACGGGIWWSTNKGYKNAIANELFFATAAKLGKKEWAAKIWKWFSSSGMINNQSLINDGLGKDCRNNGRNTYTYNQGVVLGGLSYLHNMTGDAALLEQGEKIVDAVIDHLTDTNGVLTEVHCGDGGLFKGIYVRYVRYFLDANAAALTPGKVSKWRAFLATNAASLWLSQDVEGTANCNINANLDGDALLKM